MQEANYRVDRDAGQRNARGGGAVAGSAVVGRGAASSGSGMTLRIAKEALAANSALLLGMAILMLGAGLQATLLGVRATLEGLLDVRDRRRHDGLLRRLYRGLARGAERSCGTSGTFECSPR